MISIRDGRRLGKYLVVALTLLVSGCQKGGGDAPDASVSATDSPEAVFEVAKKAAGENDWPTFCGTLTDDAREEMVAGFAFLSGFIVGASDNPDADEKERERAERLKVVLENHGLGEKDRPSIKIDLNSSEEEQKKELRKLAQPVKNHCQFISDFLDVLADPELADKQNVKLIEANAALQDLQVNDETASATFVQTREGKSSESEINFRKTDDGWKISQTPNLMQ